MSPPKAKDFIQNDKYYPTFSDKLSYLIFSISQNHPFVDGNKRTAMAIGGLFMALNGYEDMISKYFIFMESLVIILAAHKITRAQFVKIIDDYFKYEILNEETLLFIYKKVKEINDKTI